VSHRALSEDQFGELISMSRASQWLDPNVPINRLMKEEGPYIHHLASNIAMYGQKQPILVKRGGGKGGVHRIMEGHHRFAAMEHLGSHSIRMKWMDE
jgi:hypothetical protein